MKLNKVLNKVHRGVTTIPMNQAIRSFSFILGLFVLTPVHGQNVPAVTIADYPRYGTELSPAQREELRRVATAIAGTLLTGAEVNVSVFGHADFDAKGRAFETDVSRERALGAETALRALVQEESAKVGLPVSRLQSIHYTVMGLGTARPVFSQPRSEDERKANRRVDFVMTVSTPQPPVAESLFQRCVRLLTGGTPPGPVRRMTCACNKFLQQSPRVQDSHYDFRATLQIPGTGGIPSLTPEQWDVAIRGMVLHMRQDIAKASDGFSDPDFANNLRTLDDTVGRNINDFHSQLGGVETSLFHRVINADIQARMADPNHVYSCYAGYSRRNHDN